MKLKWDAYEYDYYEIEGHHLIKIIRFKFNPMWALLLPLIFTSILFTGISLFHPVNIFLKVLCYGVGLFLLLMVFILLELGEELEIYRFLTIYKKDKDIDNSPKIENWRQEFG